MTVRSRKKRRTTQHSAQSKHTLQPKTTNRAAPQHIAPVPRPALPSVPKSPEYSTNGECIDRLGFVTIGTDSADEPTP